MSELWCSNPSLGESSQTWGWGAFPVVMGSSSGTPVWPSHCLLLFLQRLLCVLDYVWPAVDAFLRVGLGGDLVTVLPNCRSVCMRRREAIKKASGRVWSLFLLSPDSPRANPERLKEKGRGNHGGGGWGKENETEQAHRKRLRTSKLHRQAECQQLVISGSWLRQWRYPSKNNYVMCATKWRR